jgi:hypothetical protein
MASLETNDDFDDFADNIKELEDGTDEIIREALDNIGERLVDYITDMVESEGKSTGTDATFDSRTSPYSPGGENDSSTDNRHLTDESGWIVQKSAATKAVSVRPHPSTSDRAYYLAKGTTQPEPDGDTPMYFKLNGFTVVVSNMPQTDAEGNIIPLETRFEGEPESVSGVDGTGYFGKAFGLLKSNDVVEEELEKAFNRKAAEVGLEEFIE